MNNDLKNLLEKMWVDYYSLNPDAKRIYDLFASKGETVVNDHVALRTFQNPRVGLEKVAKHFLKMGYSQKKDYYFPEKKLYARHYEHSDESNPKIFISELETHKLSPFIQNEVEKMISQIPDSAFESPLFPISGRPWTMTYATYSELAKESEYASWVAAFGFRPNHFTVSVNHLKQFHELNDINNFLKSNGYTLNSSGGEIKGTPQDYLEQSSTMASEIPVQFTDGLFKIPACYYEFAKRYPLESGKLYSGFVAKSADKIFESTNKL